MVNVLFKVYFRLNTIRLCTSLVRAVEHKAFASFDVFPTAQRVTYKYYVGRLAVFDENYVSPQASSQLCLPLCHYLTSLWFLPNA